MSKSAGSRPRVALKIIRQPERPDGHDRTRPARGRGAATARPGCATVLPSAPGATRVATEKVGGHQSRHVPTLGHEGAEVAELTALGCGAASAQRRRARRTAGGPPGRRPSRRSRTPRAAPTPRTAGRRRGAEGAEHRGGGLAAHLRGAGLGGDREAVAMGSPRRRRRRCRPPGWSRRRARRRSPAATPGVIVDRAGLLRLDAALDRRRSTPVEDLPRDLGHPAASRRCRWWRRPPPAAAGVTSTSPWPMAMFTLLPVRQLAASSLQVDLLAVRRPATSATGCGPSARRQVDAGLLVEAPALEQVGEGLGAAERVLVDPELRAEAVVVEVRRHRERPAQVDGAVGLAVVVPEEARVALAVRAPRTRPVSLTVVFGRDQARGQRGRRGERLEGGARRVLALQGPVVEREVVGLVAEVAPTPSR